LGRAGWAGLAPASLGFGWQQASLSWLAGWTATAEGREYN